MPDFRVTKCDVSETILEVIRFLSHIILLHIINFVVNKDTDVFFSATFLKTLLFTCLSIILYQMFVKKFFYTTIKKMKAICNTHINNSNDNDNIKDISKNEQ